ncbi:MAG: HemK2/MTQ2 family protein methyltransferase [Mycolicibacterium sp.]|uniref:HemK2/MTQ2 family protein methyltransferase n=1 Tax=Mycolicibacterium sp. TaxID=2320850 RepID=UPI003D144EA4
MTTAYSGVGLPGVPAEIYPPQQDSHLLIDAMTEAGIVANARVADLCTGSGVVAVAAAAAGAARVLAFDICPRAVQCARLSAIASGANLQVHRGSWARAMEFAPFDLVVANPPYVPQGSLDDHRRIPAIAGPAQAWNAGAAGRSVLDPLCEAVPRLLAEGGTFLVVQSECSDIPRTVAALQAGGLHTAVVAEQLIPFGPVMAARSHWLMEAGLLKPGSRQERLAVIRADAQ